VVLTALSFSAVKLSSYFLSQCSVGNLVASMVIFFLSFVVSLVSLVLWMRLAFLWVQQSLGDLEQMRAAPDWAAAAEQELTTAPEHTLPGSAHVNGVQQDGQAPSFRRPRWRLQCLRFAARSGRCLVLVVSAAILGSLFYIFNMYGSYEAFAGEVDSRWGFLVKDSEHVVEAVPVWLGEFGTSTDSRWWRYVLRYISERQVGWAYWSINGEKTNNQSEIFGLLMEDSATVRHPWKLQALQELINSTRAAAEQALSSTETAGPGGVLWN